MSLLRAITPTWLIQLGKSMSSTKETRREQYRSQINSLRSLLWMVHEHNTRYVRCPQSPQASKARDDIREYCEEMQTSCSNPQRPLFRVLNARMEQALSALPNQTKPSWYAIHHRTSDHLIYIIDEIARSYLAESKHDAMYEEYQAFWQTWIDTKESQLRFEQATMRLIEGKMASWQSVSLQSRILQKRMHQLSLISSSEVSLAFDRIDNQFDSIVQSKEGDVPASSLVKISQDLSVVLLHLFDQELTIRTNDALMEKNHKAKTTVHALPDPNQSA
ncbi:hypothetical protein L4D06_10195 [Enterovibrio makurazakiensis]|uniref:Uncharacterized protein n=1 Tax=Enterovibrio gelatinilyticus TaxID=2899819 RepID=A0ABT5R3T8_9GAMM|nr:hypothetical protein [Enterovibrio sp. ZSDZ42]MDD1794913.1 hypothetical protein [Enterovibrio sp. ZSDZ42]